MTNVSSDMLVSVLLDRWQEPEAPGGGSGEWEEAGELADESSEAVRAALGLPEGQ